MIATSTSAVVWTWGSRAKVRTPVKRGEQANRRAGSGARDYLSGKGSGRNRVARAGNEILPAWSEIGQRNNSRVLRWLGVSENSKRTDRKPWRASPSAKTFRKGVSMPAPAPSAGDRPLNILRAVEEKFGLRWSLQTHRPLPRQDQIGYVGGKARRTALAVVIELRQEARSGVRRPRRRRSSRHGTDLPQFVHQLAALPAPSQCRSP